MSNASCPVQQPRALEEMPCLVGREHAILSDTHHAYSSLEILLMRCELHTMRFCASLSHTAPKILLLVFFLTFSQWQNVRSIGGISLIQSTFPRLRRGEHAAEIAPPQNPALVCQEIKM